jgi:EAL domain-containing protein (putative c-di-GMP-specific phosphodiesterase class I)
MENVETSLALLKEFKKLDVTLGIDDFGTGYSSLSYLHRFPFDTLKVDQSFVGLMEQERESREIVTNVLSLAHGLGKEAIAEGIETAEQLASLRQLHAEFGQGYFFGKAIPADEATSLLRSRPRW